MTAPAPCPVAEAHEQDKNGYDWRSALEDLRGAYADTTIHGYARDFALFITWCNEQECCPLPASPQTVARYLDANIATLRATTLVRRLAAIVRVHRLLELENPADSERVRMARRRIQRHRPNRPRQALGVDRPLRDSAATPCAWAPLRLCSATVMMCCA
ncbi:site-specific integrase [Devosia salina]|uniref:Site-specific integrase n=1 Tax=Devosia salina TaxID=2860336 RepID=A0ABX8WEF5_9HYPH|nr:site-specific integrase [Devosia salina]QYO75097.1 site-specific integrase [Devosia salina]